jgi:3',5'-cyclic AMP phosphodiesterase CpdA
MIVVQVTDTHIKPRGRLAYRRVDSAAALAACVDHINALAPRPDAVLVTGDLVDAGSPEEYGRFRELVEPLRVPYFVIPGNHDHRANMRAAFHDHAYLRRDDEFLHYVIDDWPVRLIGLDSTRPGAPEGHLCPRRLSWLRTQLADQPGAPTLLFMHHPPFLTGIEHMDVQNCRDADALAEVLRPHRESVRLLCGHVHRAIHVTWAGVASSIGPSPSHAVALDLCPHPVPSFAIEPPACHMVTWSEARGFTTHLSQIGNFAGPYPFYHPDGALID